MTETKQDPAPTLGEIYWAAFTGADVTPGAAAAFGELPQQLRASVERGAQAVADAAVRRRAGYQGPAQHTYTTACDGFHEPGQCPRSGRQGVQVGDGNNQVNTWTRG